GASPRPALTRALPCADRWLSCRQLEARQRQEEGDAAPSFHDHGNRAELEIVEESSELFGLQPALVAPEQSLERHLNQILPLRQRRLAVVERSRVVEIHLRPLDLLLRNPSDSPGYEVAEKRIRDRALAFVRQLRERHLFQCRRRAVRAVEGLERARGRGEDLLLANGQQTLHVHELRLFVHTLDN